MREYCPDASVAMSGDHKGLYCWLSLPRTDVHDSCETKHEDRPKMIAMMLETYIAHRAGVLNLLDPMCSV